MLSDKKLAALSRGREKRWLQRQEQNKGGDVDDEDMIPEPPKLKRETMSQYADNEDLSDKSEPSPPRPEPEQWSSSEEDEEFKQKLRQREARRSIPKHIRKQIDIYVHKKLEESKQTKFLPPPISARDQESSYSRNTFTPSNL